MFRAPSGLFGFLPVLLFKSFLTSLAAHSMSDIVGPSHVLYFIHFENSVYLALRSLYTNPRLS